MRPSGSPPSAAPEGAFAPAIIVLLTDGASNTGPEPVAAAQQAVDRGIRVYTIGFGTQDAGSRPPFRQLPTDLITSHEVVESASCSPRSRS